MTEIVMILTTMPDDERWEPLARSLVDERLAACVSASDPMTSIYRWRESIERARERQLLIKTSRDLVERVRARLAELHPYELPEFLVLDVAEGDSDYIAWLNAQTSSPSGT